MCADYLYTGYILISFSFIKLIQYDSNFLISPINQHTGTNEVEITRTQPLLLILSKQVRCAFTVPCYKLIPHGQHNLKLLSFRYKVILTVFKWVRRVQYNTQGEKFGYLGHVSQQTSTVHRFPDKGSIRTCCMHTNNQ